jgi:hypothetical protein
LVNFNCDTTNLTFTELLQKQLRCDVTFVDTDVSTEVDGDTELHRAAR